MDISGFSKEQQEAILSQSSRLILKASAGSGKTTVLSHRVVHHILRHDIKPQNILVITFTTKATGELKKRILELLKKYKGEVLDLPYIANFNTFGNSIIRENFTLLGFSDIPTLISEEQRAAFNNDYFNNTALPELRDKDGNLLKTDRIKEIYSTLLNACQSSNIGKKEIREYLKQISANKAKLPDYTKQEVYEKFSGENAKTLEAFIDYYDKYAQFKMDNNLIDYSDQINLSYNLLLDNKTALEYYRNRFTHVFVDEYQDTSLVQSQLIELIANGAKLTIVGDANQSIYEWRQAEPSNIVNISGDNLYLSTNYRSVDLIVDLGNRFRLYDKTNEARAHKRREEHPVNISLYQIQQEDEAEFIARGVVEVIKKDTPLKEIAILVRGKTNVGGIIRALNKYSVPYIEYSSEDDMIPNVGLRLLGRLAVIFENTHATNLDWVFVLEHLCGLLPHEMATLKLKDNLNSISDIFARLDEKGFTERLKVLYDLYDDYLTSLLQTFTLRCKKVFIEKGILKDQGEIISYDNTILDVATVEELLEKSSRVAKIDNADSEKINILTIHSSKGLEFDTVFVPFIRKDSFPSRSKSKPSDKQIKHYHLPEELSQKRYYDEDSGKFVSVPTLYTILNHGINDAEHPLNIHAYAGRKNAAINENKIAEAYNYYHAQNKLDEERRLLYVAITRAKHNLILSGEPVEVKDDKKEVVDFFSELASLVTPVIYEPPASEISKLDKAAKAELPAWLHNPKNKQPPQIKHSAPKPDIIHLNAYSLAIFDKCNRLFHNSNSNLSTEPVFSHIDTSDDIPDNVIGNVVHNLIYQDFYSPVEDDRLDEVILSLIPAKYNSSENELNKIKKLFNNYRAINSSPERVFVEYPLSTILHKYNYRVCINVRLDRLELYPSEAVVVDYKTTSYVDEAKKGEMREQLAIYMLTLSGRMKSGIPGKKLKGMIHLLDSGKSETIDAYDDIDAVKSRLLGLANKIYTHYGDKEGFLKTDDWGKCRNCPYNVRCNRIG